MKKLFSMASLLLLAFVITGCENEPKEVHCEDGFELVGEKCIEDSVMELNFSFVDEFGNFSTEKVVLDDNYDGKFSDILSSMFDTTLIETEYGNMLVAIENLFPTTGSYISISKNGVMSTVGIDEMAFTDNDEFEFNIVWWDPTAEAVFYSIDLFIENQVQNYVNEDFIDYNVFAALNLLGITEMFVSDAEVQEYISTSYPEITTISDYFKVLSIKNSADLDTSIEGDILYDMAVPGFYGQTAMLVIGLDINERSSDAFLFDAIEFFNLNPATMNDIDGAGLDMIAYSLLDSATMKKKVSDFYAQVIEEQLPSGGVKTADTEWDGIVYPGTENAASMSMLIIGLLANGIDPSTGDLLNEDGHSLITRLLEFQTESGTFDWVLGDEVMEDTLFSTPQAFLALVSFYVYINSLEPVNPYNNN